MPDPPNSAPYRKPADVIAALIRHYEATLSAQSPGRKPPLKWLAARSRLSIASASRHRRTYYSTRKGPPAM